METDTILLEVIKSSLKLEDLINIVINNIFTVDNPAKTKNFKKNGNLKVQNKVDLFYDFDLIDKESYKKLCLQLQIRNAFVHNVEVKNFDAYLKYLSDNSAVNSFKNCSEKEDYLEKYRDLHSTNMNCISQVFNNDGKRIATFGKILTGNNACLIEAISTIGETIEQINEIFKNHGESMEEDLFNDILKVWKKNNEKAKDLVRRKHILQPEEVMRMIRGSF